MKVAVTSASGHLGSEIVKATAALLGADSVIGLARTPAKAEHLGAEIRPGDYNEPDQLADSLQFDSPKAWEQPRPFARCASEQREAPA